jgi:hypothetical protein
MAQHKRHHYVPRCYLRPFSLAAKGRAINLYNLSAERAIQNASVKGQCARDYFYGRPADLDLEKALQHIEGLYARCLRKIQNAEEPINLDDVYILREFAFLQMLRTDVAIKRMRISHDELEVVTYEASPGTRPQRYLDDHEFMRLSMRCYVDLQHYIRDLKVVVIRNETSRGFITSDDPSFFTNRFYMQKIRKPSMNFGLASSGALFFLPLTPRHQLMCYDGKTYIVSDKIGYYVSTDKSADVMALNELQYLKASENLYFHNWDDRERIEREYCAIKEYRPISWHEIDVFIPDEVTEDGERFRKATEEERVTATRTMQVMSSRYPKPLRWFSKLRHRNQPKVCSDGSAIGYVRRREWLGRKA